MTVAGNRATANPDERDHRGHRAHSGGGARHLLITLLGDYWFARDELLPSAALVDLLAEFGSQENASRQAMRRLMQRNMLVQQKQGRTTSYGIPQEIVASQRLRLARAVTFGADFTDWDGEWTVVSFSIPEPERDVRRVLRNGLRELAFGDLQDGVWITPHDRESEALHLLDELGVSRGHVMRASWALRDSATEEIAEAFDLASLADDYQRFIDELAPKLEWAAAGADPRDALRVRTQLTNAWLAFRLVDPELPASLLPDSWPRRRAREMFLRLYDLLGPAAASRVREILAAHDESLSRIVTHHSSPSVSFRLTPEMNRAVSRDRRGMW
ncbi:PaaX family transcriptional regulator [Microbacterium faecale]|uniref:PaaX family transcriptional regulator n=1 Tax=Microbacterium faecale TaxID=1804630 RepID=A0A916Y2Z0_9MICO|nr:PaaX family transcriptional regulator C-terminal domain-containing protein [Microbacterium faecale]GGD28611.1 PaaX family transcriptional regulator [Microbacterium faecale]